MAFAGKNVSPETPKDECLRRWPEMNLQSEARRYHGRIEGYVVFRNGDSSVIVAGERSASEAWRITLAKLEDEEAE